MSMKDRIAARLTEGLSPSELEIIDESHRHAHHAHVRSHPGAAGSVGETHYRIKIVSKAFIGKSRIARHRAVYDLLGAEIADGVHALALTAAAPDDA
jgi:BolA protein